MWQKYLEEKAEADPLVVLDISPLLRVNGFVNSRVGHIETHPFPEGTGYGVGRVDPAVSVQHVLRDILKFRLYYCWAHLHCYLSVLIHE